MAVMGGVFRGASLTLRVGMGVFLCPYAPFWWRRERSRVASRLTGLDENSSLTLRVGMGVEAGWREKLFIEVLASEFGCGSLGLQIVARLRRPERELTGRR